LKVMRLIAACVLASVSGLACNSGALPSDDVVVLADPLTCSSPSSSWNVVRDFGQQPGSPMLLGLRDGTLYLSVFDMGIASMPAAGGEPTMLTSDGAAAAWISGETLYYSNGSGVLRQLPIAGGPATTLLDPMAPSMNPSQWASGVAVDGHYFYWTLTPQGGPGEGRLQRTALSDATTETVATLPGRQDAYPARMWAATTETLFMIPGTGNITYAMPLGGGALRTLTAPSAPADAALNPLGVNNRGVLWDVIGSESTLTKPRITFGISDLADPPGTAARAFWLGKPGGLWPMPEGSFADGDRGWIVTGSEALADGSLHVSVWSVDAAGNGTRLGCGPALVSNNFFALIMTAVVTPDAVYIVFGADSDPMGLYYEYTLIRLDRAHPVHGG